MRSLRVALAALVLGAGLVLSGGSPAFACSCAMQSPAQHAAHADGVFAGTLADVEAQGSLFGPGGQTTYTFEVDTVYAGDPAPETRVDSESSGAACGLEGLEEGERYIVFASSSGATWSAGLCGGTAQATSGLEDRVVRAVGPGSLPDPSGGQGGAPPPFPSVVTPWAWVGGLVAVIGPLWWVLSRRATG